jgi:hypothetical protein
VRGGVKTLIGRTGRGQRDLLLENNVNERGEAGIADPEWRLSVVFQDGREMGVASREFADGFGEGLFGQERLLRVHGDGSKDNAETRRSPKKRRED